MKKTIVRIGVLFMVALLLGGCGKKPIESIRSFDFGYGTGNMMNASVRFEVRYDRKEGTYTAVVKGSGVAEEDADVYPIDESFLNELIVFLNENEIQKWDGFQKSDKHVMDGNGFHLSIWTHEGDTISASGYEKYPKNYNDVKNGIITIFAKLNKE